VSIWIERGMSMSQLPLQSVILPPATLIVTWIGP